jgi:hypothetical protein
VIATVLASWFEARSVGVADRCAVRVARRSTWSADSFLAFACVNSAVRARTARHDQRWYQTVVGAFAGLIASAKLRAWLARDRYTVTVGAGLVGLAFADDLIGRAVDVTLRDPALLADFGFRHAGSVGAGHRRGVLNVVVVTIRSDASARTVRLQAALLPPCAIIIRSANGAAKVGDACAAGRATSPAILAEWQATVAINYLQAPRTNVTILVIAAPNATTALDAPVVGRALGVGGTRPLFFTVVQANDAGAATDE